MLIGIAAMRHAIFCFAFRRAGAPIDEAIEHTAKYQIVACQTVLPSIIALG
jgi:hypothetical protein